MKKLLTIALMTALSITASAQGIWEVSHRQADPMKGQMQGMFISTEQTA